MLDGGVKYRKEKPTINWKGKIRLIFVVLERELHVERKENLVIKIRLKQEPFE